MTGSRCTLCKRDVDRAAMSRCRDDRCPSRPRSQRGSSSVWIGGGIGALILGSIVIGSWLFAAPAGKAAATDYSGEAAPQNRVAASRQVISRAGTNVAKWLDTLVAAPGKRAADDMPAQAQDARYLIRARERG